MSLVSHPSAGGSAESEQQISDLVQLAFRRKILTLAVDHLGIVFSLIFGGLALVLLLGTQILNAWLIPALAVAGATIGWFRVRADLPDRYRLAQVIDRKLQLHDSISTAFFLLSNSERHPPFAVRTQVDRAGALASAVNIAEVFPFAGRRQWIITAVLLGAAAALFTARYLVTDSLDLSLALIPVHFGPVYERVEKLFAQADPKHEIPANGMRRDLASTQAGKNQTAEERSAQPQDPALAALNNPAGPSTDAQSTGDPSASKTAGQADDTSGDKANGGGDGKQRDNASPHDANASSTPSSAAKSSPNDSDQKKEASADAKTTTGVLEKMRDAVSSMMAKMKAASSGESSQENKNQRESQQSAQQSSQKQDQQRGQPGDQSQQSSEDPNSQGQQQGDSAQKAQASEGRTSNSSSNQKGSDSHSGIGSQDGEKALRDARQQETMGKLAEIIGKRSAELTGDVMVDVPSGKQQLRTKDSRRLAKHSDTGGEINRDQVPLEFQQYIRDYMEQVRKQPK